jgi:hypothetical protein
MILFVFVTYGKLVSRHCPNNLSITCCKYTHPGIGTQSAQMTSVIGQQQNGEQRRRQQDQPRWVLEMQGQNERWGNR